MTRAAGVAHEVEPPEHFAEDRARQHAAVGHLAQRDDLEDGRRGDRRRARASPPIQTAIARTAANRSTSIPIIIIDRRSWTPSAGFRGAPTPSRARAPRTGPCSCRSPRRGASRASTWTARPTPIRPSPASSTTGSCPIRVDADRRPDISDRYSLGGWPTTAFLTAEGDDHRRRHVRRRRPHAVGARARGRGVPIAAATS